MICTPCKTAGQWITWAANRRDAEPVRSTIRANALETAEGYHECCKGAIQRTQCDCQHKTDSALVRKG